MPTEQEIREICARLLLAHESDQFQAALTELKIAIREHIAEAENKGIHLLLKMSKAASESSGTEG